MKGTTFASYVRLRTKTDSTSFTDANISVYANVEKEEISGIIESEVDENYFVLPATTGLVAGQREYAFPNDLLNSLKMVEIKQDGTNWKRCWEFDLNSYRRNQSSENPPYDTMDIPNGFAKATSDETAITDYFSDSNPTFEIARGSITIYTETALTTVSAGLKIRYAVYPNDISTTQLTSSDDLATDPSTTTFGVPRAFHKYWAMKVVISYKEDNGIPLDIEDGKIEIYLARAKKGLRDSNKDRPRRAMTPKNTGRKY